jgi:hypothetical protein
MQYMKPLIPSLKVKSEDFEEHKLATQFINKPDIANVIHKIIFNTKRYHPSIYDSHGITIEMLKKMIALDKQREEQKTKV